MGKRSERNISSLALPNSVINSDKRYNNKMLKINGLVAILKAKNNLRSVGLLGFIVLLFNTPYSSIVLTLGLRNAKRSDFV